MARMKISIIFSAAAIIFALAPTESLFAKDQCVECHQTTGDKPSELFKHDIHFQKGVGCAGCHGGNAHTEDMEQAMDKKNGFLGVPKGDEISKTCAACHSSPEKMKSFGSSLPTNQWAFLQTSVHAKLSLNGKEHIVQCITCHHAHGIVPVKNPSSPVYPLNVVKTCTRCHADAALMRSYNPSLPIDQLEKYRTSVHGLRNAKGDAKTAECASCHGSHDIRSAKDVKSKVYASTVPETCAACHSNVDYMKPYKIPTDQYEKYTKSVHGIALLQKHDQGAPACNNCHGNHGAMPPGVESVSKVCGTCHALNADLFSRSPHKKAFDERNLPECETCHGNHGILPATDKLLGISPDAVCRRCHNENENIKGYQSAGHMSNMLDSLETDERSAINLVDNAEQKGMEISEAKFKLREVRQARLQARTVIHAFNEEQFQTTILQGRTISVAIIQEAKNAVDEYYFRRIGLFIATLIISLVALLLFLYVRRMEKK
jgi:predicted CXXCH cytochrome family protein